MRNLVTLAFRVSRFRFWIYTAGTYVVGYAMGMNSWLDFLRLEYFVFLLYFFFPANVFLYGVNDYWDEEVDRFNPKKGDREFKMSEGDRRDLLFLIYVTLGISLLLLLLQKNLTEQLILISFLLLSYLYSAKPVRFKTIPFLDFASNFLYIIPGILGYYQVGRSLPPFLIVLAGFMHTSSMQLFSAIPDTEYDRRAKIKTTAVLLKRKVSLILCLVFWVALASIVMFLSDLNPLSLLVIIYPMAPLVLLLREDLDINRIYWILPYINTVLGGLLFTTLTISKAPTFQ